MSKRVDVFLLIGVIFCAIIIIGECSIYAVDIYEYDVDASSDGTKVQYSVTSSGSSRFDAILFSDADKVDDVLIFKDETFDANGVATENTGTNTGNNTDNGNGITFTWFDAKHGRNFTIMNEFKKHPGIADGTKSDLDILAAVCEAEAGDQGIAGMKAVALCILNRTLDNDFPSSVRYVLYQGTTFPQYSVVTNGNLLKRLNGQFEDRESAYTAAQQALAKIKR